MRRGVSPHVQPQVPPPLIGNIKTLNHGRLGLRLPGVQEHQPTHFKDRAERERERECTISLLLTLWKLPQHPHTAQSAGPH